MDAPDLCPSCAAPFQGKYCQACGEKRLEANALDLGPFLHELFHFETHLDNKVAATLKPLLGAPGRLTADWIEGRRAAFAKPLQLFVVLNLLFFLLAPKFGILGWDLAGELRMAPDSALAHRIAELQAAKGWPREALLALATQGLDAVKRSLFLVLMPATALMLKALRPGRRMVEHLVFSIHYACFSFLWLLALGVLLGTAARVFHFHVNDDLAVPLLVLGLGTQLFLALRTVYGGGLLRRSLEAAFIAVSFVPLLLAVKRVGFWWMLRGLS